MTDRRLFDATLPPGAGADLVATRHAGLVRISPCRPSAAAWLRAAVGPESSWDGDDLVMERSYFEPLADAAIAAGLTFERDALPN